MSDALLTLGVDDDLLHHDRVFNVGGIGEWTHDRPFDVLRVLVAFAHERPFNIGSVFSWEHTRPFTIGETLSWQHDRPFDIIATNASGGPGVEPHPGLTGPGSPNTGTTLTAPASTGSASITVATATGITIGARVLVGSDVRSVTNVVGSVLTLSAAPSVAWASGSVVQVYTGTTASAAGAGATTLTLGSVSNMTNGSVLRIDSGGVVQFRTVTNISGSVVTLSLGLGSAISGGALVALAEGGFLASTLQVYDKGGHPLGALTKFTVPEARSQGVLFSGQMQIQVPATHPDRALLLDDCLIAVVSSVGVPTWGGSFGRQTTNDGAVTVNCPDISDQFTGYPIDFTEDERQQTDGTLATAVYQLVLNKLNNERAAHGEVAFQADFSGVKTFRGDLQESAEAIDFFGVIARRSQTEWAWRVEIQAGLFVPFLVVRDVFTAPAGVAFTDGVGGNIEDGSIRYISDPGLAIRKLKLTGQPTNIAKYLPDWAKWAAHEITPEVTRTEPEPTPAPGVPRFRADLQVAVDWSLSKAEQQRLAALTEEKLWGMFYSFIYAWHDLNGMPFHPKWAYEGPPTAMESDLHLPGWHTHQELGFYRTTTYAHIVMVNEDERKWLVQLYFASTEVKSARIVGFDEAFKYPLPRLSYVPVGTVINIYEVQNKEARFLTTFTWTDPNERWALYFPVVVHRANGHHITVRGILNGPFQGRYVNTSEDPWVLGYLPTGPALDDVGDLVTTVLGFERGRVTEWDPRRDGVGEYLNRPTVFSAKPTTRARWHIVPFSVGDAAETHLVQGVYLYDTVIYVESVDGHPDTFPYTIRVGEAILGFEEMVVLSRFGGALTVRRGTSLLTTLSVAATAGDFTVTTTVAPDATIVTGNAVVIGGNAYIVAEVTGTTVRLQTALTTSPGIGASVQFTTAAVLHETGSPVTVVGAKGFDGFEFPYEWPEGEQYASEFIAKRKDSKRVIGFHVVNRNDTWRSASVYGSTHTITITTEGIINATGTVLAFSPDEEAGTMEVIVEI